MEKRIRAWLIATGIIVGLSAVMLTELGNPGNMGFCTVCFIRDIAGALGLHRTGAVQYFRPEIVGLVLGATGTAVFRKEWKPVGGSAPFLRFMIGWIVAVGALMFLGCPLRMMLRLSGGDWNALPALVGFICGVGVGSYWLTKGFSLKRTYNQTKEEGVAMPALLLSGLILALLIPPIFFFSTEGPGSMHAPWIAALVCGIAIGSFAQRSRFCIMGGIRDVILFRDLHLLWGTLSIVIVTFLANLLLKNFHPGFIGQPVAHTNALWNFIGMVIVGWGSVLLGGCPMRQLVMAGEGNSDSAVTVLGIAVGAAMSHNWNLASSAQGPTLNGKIAVLAGLVILIIISISNVKRSVYDGRR